MERFNLWVVNGDDERVVCYGDQCDMNSLAVSAGLPGDVYVLPDGLQPNQPQTFPCQSEA
jgi:hypothetical protein